jgi:two-component system chemotaxis response regulator CheY
MSEFKDISALVIDPSGHSKALLKSILTNLNVARVAAVTHSEEALLILRKDVFSIVFCDELSEPANPIEFLKALRRDLTTRDVTVPVVMISSGADTSKIKSARDAGMSDVIAKPVSVRTIERKLRSLLVVPRNFVTTRTFVGPDRRRFSEERRQFGERPDGEDRRGKSQDGTVFAMSSRLNPDAPAK